MTHKQQAEQAAQVQELTGQVQSFKAAGFGPRFAKLVFERQELKSKIKELEARCEPLTEELQVEMMGSPVKSVKVDDYQVTLVDSVRTHLSKEKLLELGVSPSVIEQATVSTPSTSLRVTDTGKAKVGAKERKAKVTSIKTAKSKGSGKRRK